MQRIAFKRINAAALAVLPALLQRWLPDGRVVGNEYVCRNPKRQDRHAGSFQINLVTGRWADFAVPDVRGGDVISLAAYLADLRHGETARRLATMFDIKDVSNGCG
jgi:hypothetical protein